MHRALHDLPHVDYVVSGLTFDNGTHLGELYASIFVPLLERYAKKHFPENKPPFYLNWLANIANWAQDSEISRIIGQYAHTQYPLDTTTSQSGEIHYQRKNHAAYETLIGHINELRQGRMLPLGIVISEGCKEERVPVVLVSNLAPEDHFINALYPRLHVPCYDRIDSQGHKAWQEAIEHVVRIRK